MSEINFRLRIYPDPILRQKAKPVAKVSRRIRELAAAMFELLDQSNGVGLAAQQAGLLEAIAVFNVPVENSENIRLVLINPAIIKKSRKQGEYEEGCLSFPGIYTKICRPETVTVEALNLDGKKVKIEADRLFARALQHECDHLNGILMVDHVDETEKKRIDGNFTGHYRF